MISCALSIYFNTQIMIVVIVVILIISVCTVWVLRLTCHALAYLVSLHIVRIIVKGFVSCVIETHLSRR